MINIIEKENCCGCGACEQSCPKQCISMFEDCEGFLYPRIDMSLCIECGLCEKVCPVINQGEIKEPLHVYAAKNKNEEIRSQSSSGGVFTLLAERTILSGGVVFGAVFNDRWEVMHSYIDSIDGLAPFRGSKYMQSRIGEAYKNVKTFLNAGREVLFVGTPCQIRGLRLFLRKDYEKLLAVDILCHGVPSTKVWRMYLDEVIRTKYFLENEIHSLSMNEISNISFRDKSTGWNKFSFKIWGGFEDAGQNEPIFSEAFTENIYMRGFLNDLYLRPSCHKCPSKQGKSGSDITIADYWGIRNIIPEFDDDKGVGLILINTVKGNNMYPIESTNYIETGYHDCQKWNGGLKTSLPKHPKRKMFFKRLDSCTNLSSHIIANLYYPRITFLQRVKNKVRVTVKRIIK